jgi:hypothetical protein
MKNKFIVAENEGLKVLINVDKIKAIVEKEGIIRISLGDDEHVDCESSIDYILELIKDIQE